jgi:phage I-like protein
LPEPDVTENFIRLRQIDPGRFKPKAMRDGADFVTITLDASRGIRAVYGELKNGKMAIQSYVFDKTKGDWTLGEAEKWVAKHEKTAAKDKRVEARHLRYIAQGGDPDLLVMRRGDCVMLAAVTPDTEVIIAQAPTIKLNPSAVDHARQLIRAGHIKNDAAWSPSAAQMNRLLGQPPNWKRYGSWHLGINTGGKEKTKDRYRFPFGHGSDVFRRALAAAAQRASQFGYPDIQKAASSLIELIKTEEAQATETDIVILELDTVLAAAAGDFQSEHLELDDNGVPTAFRILEFGKWELSLPDVPPELIVDDTSAKAQMAYYKERGMPKLPMDYAHKSASKDGKAPEDESSPGWWVPEPRKDGIWAAQLDWSPKAYEQLKNKEIRHHSPDAVWNRITGKLVYIKKLALTNDPATRNQLPLVASATKQSIIGDRRMEKLLELLGLKMEATEDEAAKAVKDLQAKAADTKKKDDEIATLKATIEQGTSDKPDTKELDSLKSFQAGTLEALGLKEGDLQAVKAEIGKRDLKDNSAEMVAMKAKLDVLEKGAEENRVKDLLAKHDDKILPAKREKIEKMARELSTETFDSIMAELPTVKGDPTKPIGDKGLDERNKGKPESVLSTEEWALIDADLQARGETRETDNGKAMIAAMIKSKNEILAMHG